VGEDEEDDLQKALALSLKEQKNPGRPVSLDESLPLAANLGLSAKFALHSVVSHVGSTAHNGHYICDVWDEKTRVWKCYNDSLMSEVGSHSTLNQKRGRSGYLFFFTSAES